MTKKWEEVVGLRMFRTWCKCEFCFEKFKPKDKIVGHHILGKDFQEKFNLEESDYCRVRHDYCEKLAHETLPNGNLPEEQKIYDEIRKEV